jgi:hypothetical protein
VRRQAKKRREGQKRRCCWWEQRKKVEQSTTSSRRCLTHTLRLLIPAALPKLHPGAKFRPFAAATHFSLSILPFYILFLIGPYGLYIYSIGFAMCPSFFYLLLHHAGCPHELLLPSSCSPIYLQPLSHLWPCAIYILVTLETLDPTTSYI